MAWLDQLISYLEKNWPALLIEILLFGVVASAFGLVLGSCITESLKPETDISVTCEISEGLNRDYNLEFNFKNPAGFAGKNTYFYLWGVSSGSWGSDFSVSEHCEVIKRELADHKSRLKIFCDMIPPGSEFGFNIESDSDELKDYILDTERIVMEWWGETTPYKKDSIPCEINL